jgi:hypothetical protein
MSYFLDLNIAMEKDLLQLPKVAQIFIITHGLLMIQGKGIGILDYSFMSGRVSVAHGYNSSYLGS